jgi:NDP-sugar pyrophosphorylase family protein
MMVGGALVLAAGKSTRITPVSRGLPKPLLSLGGEPVIGRNLRWLARSGITQVWVNLHYQAETVRECLGDGSAWGLSIRYVHEPEILGTAGAWRNLADHWRGTTLVVYGDNLARFDVASLVRAHGQAGTVATVALFDPEVHVHTGMAGGKAALNGSGRIRQFVEGGPLPQGTRAMVNVGAYLLEPALLERIPPGFSDFGRDVLPRMAASNPSMMASGVVGCCSCKARCSIIFS